MKRKIFSKLLMGAFLIASVSMFVSCKDYDDDIQKNAQDIQALKAAMGTDINAAKSDLAAQLSTANAELNTAIENVKKAVDGKAGQSEIDALKKDATDLAGKISALETKLAALEGVEGDLAKLSDAIGGNAAKISELEGQLAAITGEMKDYLTADAVKDFVTKGDAEAIAAAAVATLENQLKTFESYEARIKDLEGKVLDKGDVENLTKEVADLKEQLSKIDIDEAVKKLDEKVDEAINDLKKEFQPMSESISKVNEGLDAIMVFVNKKLTALVLKPDFYWEGIEGIEAPFIYQTPVFKPENKDYKFKFKLTKAPAGKDEVDVTVKQYMTWDGGGNRELGKYVIAGPAAYHYLYPVAKTTGGVIDKDKNGFYLYDMGHKDVKAVKKIDIAYGAEAKYHLNPSIADIKGATIGFYDHLAEVYTRGENTGINATPLSTVFGGDDDQNTLANGILTVPFSLDYLKVVEYFTKWTNTQTNDWEGNSAANKEDWTSLWYETATGAVYGTDDKDTNAKEEYVFNGGKLPFVSLQIDVPANAEKGIDAYSVNSDYAVVVPALYEIVALADNAPEEGLDQGTFLWENNANAKKPHEIRKNHLYETVGYNDNGIQAEDALKGTEKWNNAVAYGAIPMPATHSVLYNGSIDLSKFVETHFNYRTFARYGKSAYDDVLDKVDGGALFKKLGLKYNFTIIHYMLGEEKTSESAHIEQDATNPSVFYPRSVTADGKTITGETATREVVDREPLIRVDLVDTKTNSIIRYGYIKLRIVDTVSKDLEVSIPLDDAYMNCGDEKKITWSQVENLILAKLGQEGFTKQEFEKNYYLEVEGAYKNMPYIDPSKNASAAADGDPAGALYTPSWTAVRYVKDGGKFKLAKDETAPVSNWSATDNHFGEVWYTPHDNETEGHNWDPQTNVLIWNLYPGTFAATRATLAAKVGKEQAGNMDKEKYAKLMEVSGVTYDTKGTSTKAISTVVRFINKLTGKSIYVTLEIPAEKLHFEYGEIGNKNWSHWFEFNSVKTGSPASASPYWTEFDTRINPFKPSNVNYRFLEVTDFNNMLTDHWMKPSEMLTYHGGGNFSKFEGAGKWASSVDFTLTWPVKDLNSTISATKSKIKIDGNDVEINWWKVKGASSDKKGYTEWTLVIGKHGATWSAGNTAIFAVQKDGNAYASEEVAYLDEGAEASTVNEKLIFHGIETAADLYPAATSLVNYMGAYDEKANPRFSTTSNELTNLTKGYFLEDNIDRAFTAYVKINIGHACYDPLIAKQFFNVRFHRPINVVAKVYDWNDRNLADNTIEIKDLIEIVDWNRFPVVPFGTDAKIAANKTMFGMDFPKYADVFASAGKVKQQEYGIPYEFYGIQELAIRYGEIRSDMPKTTDVRSKIYTTANDIISNTVKVKDIPALFSDREAPAGYKTVTLLNADGTIAGFNDNDYNLSNYTGTQATAGNTSFGKVYFNNDGSDTQLFHIYLPIAVKYNWGNIAFDKTLGTPAKLDKDYTQVVWAVITVTGTH